MVTNSVATTGGVIFENSINSCATNNIFRNNITKTTSRGAITSGILLEISCRVAISWILVGIILQIEFHN